MLKSYMKNAKEFSAYCQKLKPPTPKLKIRLSSTLFGIS